MIERPGTPQHKHVVIGERLRASREQRSITLEEAAVRTKIHASVLEALESGEMVQRLGSFYAKGFLKKYGAFLGVDVQPWLDDVSRTTPTTAAHVVRTTPQTASTTPKATPEPVTAPPEKPPFQWTIPWEIDWEWMRRVARPALVALVVVIAGSWTVKTASSAWRTRAARPARIAPAVRATAAPQATPKPPAQPQATLLSSSARPAPLIKASTPLTLTVLPKRDVWMRVQTDGKIVFQNVLTVGTAERWRATERFDLWVGDADALTLDLNGHDLGAPGRGVQKNIVVTREGLRLKP